MSAGDTIYALASAPGRAGVAVLRLSGPGAASAILALTRRPPPPPRQAALRRFLDEEGEPLDEGLALFFPGPSSFTGEDVAELHIHGGAAVLEAFLRRFAALEGLRQARPGEFTRRAFENGRLDLTAAEGLADLVEAETEAQRRQAFRQLRGDLEAVCESWRGRLIAIQAYLEAEIDFPDEDLPGGLAARTAPLIEALAGELEAHLADARRGERVRDGFRIAILGAPNAGKSSLLNALARREAAIVTDRPGTTRDVVEVRLVLGGQVVWIADTAGLRDTHDPVEAEGVRRAKRAAAEADLRLALAAPDAPLTDETRALLGPGDLVVRSKADIPDPPLRGAEAELSISAQTGEGLAGLKALIAARAGAGIEATEAPPLTRARHREEVSRAAAALRRALGALDLGPELAAEDVRAAAAALGRLTGRIDVEDVLGEIFSSFCIGK